MYYKNNELLKANKGEWSEIYVLFRLLSEGKLYSYDNKHITDQNNYLDVLRIIRKEYCSNRYEYVIDGVQVKIYLNNNLINSIGRSIFRDYADILYSEIKKGKGRNFSISKIEEFMKKINCYRVTESYYSKTDIVIQVYNSKNNFYKNKSFSIKSFMGNPPSLLNANDSTNFIFELSGINDKLINYINSIDSSNKIQKRMKLIFSEFNSIKFVKVQDIIFNNNMMFIDSNMPEFISNLLIYHYRYNISFSNDIIDRLAKDNPMNYPDISFYEYKYKKFLSALALGMTTTVKWDGKEINDGGNILVNSKGFVFVNMFDNRDYFEDFLYINTKIERASTIKFEYAKLYKEDNKVFLKLNLQIRFKQLN